MTTMISEVYSAFKTAGVPEQEAQEAAEAMSAENLATRNALAADKRDLSNDIAGAEQRLSDKIAAVRQELTVQIATVEQKLSDKIAAVKQELTVEIGTVKQELTDKIVDARQQVSAEIGEVRRIVSVIRWMLGFMLVAMALPILREIIVAWP